MRRIGMLCISVLMVLTTVVNTTLAETKTYTMALTTNFGELAPVVVAQRKGFFQEEGIAIDYTVYASVNDWYNAVLYERKDIALPWAEFYIDLVLSNTSYKVIGVFENQTDVVMVVKKGIDPKSIHVIGTLNEASVWKWFAWKYFTKFGMSLDDKKFVVLDAPDLFKNFQSNRIQAFVFVRGAVEQILQAAEGEVGFAVPEGFVPTSLLFAIKPATLSVMSASELKGFWRAIIRANQWVNNPANRTELRQLLLKEVPELAEMIGIADETVYTQKFDYYTFYAPEALRQSNAALQASMKSLLDFRSAILHQDVSAIDLEQRLDTSVLLKVLEELKLTGQP